jgi:hypothetical protein
VGFAVAAGFMTPAFAGADEKDIDASADFWLIRERWGSSWI